MMDQETTVHSGGAGSGRPRNFTVLCWPGAGAFTSAREWEADRKALVLYLDPVTLVLSVPPISDGEFTLVRFCRQLASEASRLAAELDPGSAGTGGGRS